MKYTHGSQKVWGTEEGSSKLRGKLVHRGTKKGIMGTEKGVEVHT